jgi:lipopolysaccharide export system permease protein
VRRETTLRLYLVRIFAPALIGSLALFMLILELVDLFNNLWRYLSLGVPASSVLRVMILFLPTAASNALPIALLFASTFSLATLYADNELTVVFGSGVSLWSFTAPLFAIAAALCVGSFLFDDRVVLSTLMRKNELSRALLSQKAVMSKADVAVISRDGEIVYRAEYYDDATSSLSEVTVVERDSSGRPIARVEASTAKWDGSRWVFGRVRRFERRVDGSWTDTSYGTWVGDRIDEPPDAFRSQNRDLGEMSVSQLAEYAAFLKRAGLPFAAAVAERQDRFSFAFTPIVVVLLAGAAGGWFRKNVLLASLLTSIVLATGYYVARMLAMLMANTGAIDPRAGAWVPLIVYLAAGVALFRTART